MFSDVSQFALGAPDKIVGNETELRAAINNAPTKKSYTIALNNDIALSVSSLTIPANKDITLTSNSKNEYYKLFNGIIVESGGVLKFEGIIVTNSSSSGVTVKENGLFILYSGEISGNSGYTHMWGPGMFSTYGGGVYNNGTFEMHGGKISGNQASIVASHSEGYGGGVYNGGIFKMYGGAISNNYAENSGGGVYNLGTFTISGGEITGNRATFTGGVTNSGTFERLGGVISGNSGGDVYPSDNVDNGSPSGNGSSTGGSDGSSGGNSDSSKGDNGTSTDKGGQFGGGFSLRDVVVMCVGVVVVSLCVVVVVLLLSFQKRIEQIETKINHPIDGQVMC